MRPGSLQQALVVSVVRGKCRPPLQTPYHAAHANQNQCQVKPCQTHDPEEQNAKTYTIISLILNNKAIVISSVMIEYEINGIGSPNVNSHIPGHGLMTI